MAVDTEIRRPETAAAIADGLVAAAIGNAVVNGAARRLGACFHACMGAAGAGSPKSPRDCWNPVGGDARGAEVMSNDEDPAR